MSTTAAAISIEGLSKAYRLGHQLEKSETIGEALFSDFVGVVRTLFCGT